MVPTLSAVVGCKANRGKTTREASKTAKNLEGNEGSSASVVNRRHHMALVVSALLPDWSSLWRWQLAHELSGD